MASANSCWTYCWGQIVGMGGEAHCTVLPVQGQVLISNLLLMLRRVIYLQVQRGSKDAAAGQEEISGYTHKHTHTHENT